MALTVGDIGTADLDTLPLLVGVPFQSGAGWWRGTIRAALPPDRHPRFLLVRRDGIPVTLLPLLMPGCAAEGQSASALTTPYTCLYQPPCSPGVDLVAVGAALAPHLPPLLRIDAIDPDWFGWNALVRGFRRAGRRSVPFAGFGNWHEPVGGTPWAGYLARRPGALRETIRRRLGRAERDPSLAIALAETPQAAAELLVEYEQVHARSWKAPEPFPGFAATLIAEAAAAGVLRIAVLRRAGVPLAAQYWIVEQGVATVLKLTHDEAARSESPGTVLTAWMIRRLIDEEHVTTLDFGRGDDPYKRHWASVRRQRDGLIVADPWHPVGAAALLRQAAGRIASSVVRFARG